MSRTHDSRPSQLKLKLPTSPSRQRSIENHKYISSKQTRTPTAAQEHSTVHINIRPTSSDLARTSNAADHPRFEAQRNYGLSKQKQETNILQHRFVRALKNE
jgi:hypothetical protein